MKTRFIVNVRSGRAARLLPAVRTFAETRGAQVVLTERARHAFDLARTALADGCGLIVAVGGDGTMNETASALINTSAVLGLVPAGSGDGFGRHLGVHGSLAHALAILEHGRIHTIDTGTADGHAFVCAAGIGFEAEVVARFNRSRRRGFLRYLLTSAQLLRDWQAQEYLITARGDPLPVRAFTLVIANASQYGNNARIAPHARLDDGMLDLCAVPPVTPWNGLRLATQLFAGTLGPRAGLLCLRGERFTVERESPGPLHTDGEVYSAGRTIEFVVHPRSLRVMGPAR